MRLPWLQIDTNVFPRLDSLAGLLGIPNVQAYGLAAQLWAWAIDWGPADRPPNGEVISDRAAEIIAHGIGWKCPTCPADTLIRCLSDVGLVVAIDGGIRIKGMDRYAAAWTAKDKSSAKAAKWREQKRKWRESVGGQVADKTEDKSRTNARQTSKTETETESIKASAAKKPAADPRLKPLTETLAVAFEALRGEKYRHSGAKDATALKSLLAIATDEAIASRWATGLRATGWASCNTFAQLAAKWNDLAAPTKTLPQEAPLRML